MNHSELQAQYIKFNELLEEKKVNEAMAFLKPMAAECHNSDVVSQLETSMETYQNLLKYSFAQYEDPEKNKIYHRLLRSLYELGDLIKEALVSRYHLLSYTSVKRELERKTVLTERDSSEIVESIAFEKEIKRILDDFSSSGSSEDSKEKKLPHQELSRIFNILWLSDNFHEPEVRLVKGLVLDPVLPWPDKCLVVTAITLSLFRYFDQRKFELLFDITDARENQVWQRALSGLILSLFIYNNRISLYPDLLARLSLYQGNDEFEKNLEIIYIQIIKSQDTEKITKKFQDEIYPEMMKLRPRLEDKLDLENILSENPLEDRNPEWESLINETPGLFQKLEEFSMLQMEGSDVFLSAFAMLKQFDFFRELANWFVPFYKENKVVQESLEGIRSDFDVDSFINGLEKSAFLCNSDKYSFCLNVNRMPALQKSMMMQLFNMELNAMNEISGEDEMLNRSASDRSVFTQYFQDLYRFYKLYPLRHEFNDVFANRLDLHNSTLYNLTVNKDEFLKHIAEFHFSKDHFIEALDIFLLLDKGENMPELWQKLAYCYHKTERFDKAVAYYLKASLIETPGLWTLKKIAWCYRKIHNYPKALEYYKKAELLAPDDLQIQTSLGHTSLDLKEYEKALKYYFKVEYLAPENYKVHRPIAWCCFVLGRFEQAAKYFEEVIRKGGNQHDYMNLGHVQWCLKNKEAAMQNYKDSLRSSTYKMDWFEQVFVEDGKILCSHGIDAEDLPLMLDYLSISLAAEWPAN
jgi:tetratricopeptide (TPR) repeat protein